jgi:protocatechuate 3,4-dioxygenase beta subunit
MLVGTPRPKERGAMHETTRRQAIGAAGATGVAFLLAGRASGALSGNEVAQAASATCVMTPNKTIGPYFVEEKLNRTDITTDADGTNAQPGTPLALTMYLFDADNDCAPVTGAQVDIWHANHQGKYSDESANGTTGHEWMRGYQVTDAGGKVTFNTMWPGWYSGRAVHIHFRVRTASSDFTSQMFFTDEMNSTVFADEPYAGRGDPDVSDGQDNILGSDADTLTLAPVRSGSGYAADFSVGLSGASSTTPSATATPTPSSTADITAAASLASAKALRLASGRRLVRVRVKTEEAITITARLTRSGHRLARETRTLEPGTHVLRLLISNRAKAGAARLTVRVADAAGNSKVFQRSVHVPRRKP